MSKKPDGAIRETLECGHIYLNNIAVEDALWTDDYRDVIEGIEAALQTAPPPQIEKP